MLGAMTNHGVPTRGYVTELSQFLLDHGAAKRGHTGATLYDHLMATAAILESWNAPDHVCKAALFHSIYGTEYFKDAVLTLADRDRVRPLIGDDAERIAYLFCVFERRSLYTALDRGEPFSISNRDGTPMPVSPRDIQDLAYVVWANALEQLRRAPKLAPDVQERSRVALGKVAAVLPAHVVRELEAAYGAAIRPTPKTTPGLAALFAIDDPRTFLNRPPDQLFIARGGVERLAGLCDFDLEQLIAMKRNFTKAFRVIDGKRYALKVEPGQERALYEAGFVLYFHSLHTPTMDAWVNAITDELGFIPGVTRVSAFASKRGQGLKAHYDQNDNFVCQARGSKRWRVAKNVHVVNPTIGYTIGEKPTPANAAEAPNGFPSELPTPFEVVDMTPGTVMFMPNGMWHDTETTDDASLHFNIQTGAATWKDVVEYLLIEAPVLHGIEDLRTRLSASATRAELDAQFRQELKAKLAVVCERLLTGEIDVPRDGLYRFIARRRSAN
jgi:hypothetical protein